MYELIILSLLMLKPMHGYLISKIMNNIVGPYARFSNGRLYPLLAKLEADSFIAVYNEADADDGGRPSRSYAITDKGRERFRELMLDTTSNPGDYRHFFLQKAQVLHFLVANEALHIIDHYILFCQAHLLHMQTKSKVWMESIRQVSEAQYETEMDVLVHLRDQWQLELAWAQKLRGKYDSKTG